MEIRDAQAADAAEACEVMKRSIAELCLPDHNNDSKILAAWLGNKTPQNVRNWIENEDIRLLVAVEKQKIVSVGAVNRSGEITLNYVSPDTRFRGFSRAMLRRLEQVAKEWGHRICRLTSTETARDFYGSSGYVPSGEPKRLFGTGSAYPMTKQLDENHAP